MNLKKKISGEGKSEGGTKDEGDDNERMAAEVNPALLWDSAKDSAPRTSAEKPHDVGS